MSRTDGALKAYLQSFAKNFFIGLLLSIFPFGIGALMFVNVEPWQSITIFFFLFFVSYATFGDALKVLVDDLYTRISTLEKENKAVNEKLDFVSTEEKTWRQTLKEKSQGFPTLLSLLEAYEQRFDDIDSHILRTKSHPAIKSADQVKYHAELRRNTEKEIRKTKSIIEYYESIAPFLLDFKEEIQENNHEIEDYTEEEKADPVVQYVAKQEFKNLPPAERNQLALDRFWKRPKSKWLIGRLYERYVGYLFEQDGYDVEYHGIFKGYEDLGRDLICYKGDEIIVIQCKNWSKFKNIYENHIFQFFGTVFQYRDSNKDKKVRSIFYTTTSLSPLAKRFAGELNMELVENHTFDQSYPSIKCNVGSKGEKIYHLPFDQQYDKVKIEPHKGEFYCATVKEAEAAGFRRAFRWKGQIM